MGACRPAQKGPVDHGRYAISGGLEVLEDEWKVGAPCNCADTVYFMDIKPGGQSHSLYCHLAGLLQPYRTHLGPSVAYILPIPSRIGRHGELNAPTSGWQFVVLGLSLFPNVVGCLHPQLEPHKR